MAQTTVQGALPTDDHALNEEPLVAEEYERMHDAQAVCHGAH